MRIQRARYRRRPDGWGTAERFPGTTASPGPRPDPFPAGAEHAGAAAGLHAQGIPEGFLVTLGPRFLRRLYRRITRSPHAFLLVTTDGDGVTGFVAVTEHTGRLYRDFLVHDGLPAALAALPAVARAPRRVWETLRYGAEGNESLPEAEILAVAVADRAQGQGLGTQLVRASVAELARRGVVAAQVVTASDNQPALRMYEKAGFERVGRTEVHRGTAQEVLVWR